MNIFDAYEEMKIGKVIGMYDKDNILINKLKLCDDKLMCYCGSYFKWVKSSVKFNDLLDYTFEVITMYELDFVSALEEMFKGKKIETEYSQCIYWFDKSKIHMKNISGKEKYAYFLSEEIEGKWRVVE